MKIVKSLKEHFVAWVWNHTPNCAEISRLESRSFETSLPIQTRIRMCLHYLICVWCKRYARHLTYLHAIAPRLNEHAENFTSRGLSVEAKHRIVQSLQNEQ